MEHIPLFVQNSRMGMLLGTFVLGMMLYGARRCLRAVAGLAPTR